jgi:hypothetical protein
MVEVVSAAGAASLSMRFRRIYVGDFGFSQKPVFTVVYWQRGIWNEFFEIIL